MFPGASVPIPTLPLFLIRILSVVALVPEFVLKIKSVGILFWLGVPFTSAWIIAPYVSKSVPSSPIKIILPILSLSCKTVKLSAVEFLLFASSNPEEYTLLSRLTAAI